MIAPSPRRGLVSALSLTLTAVTVSPTARAQTLLEPTAPAPAATAIALAGAPTVGTLHLRPGFTPDPVNATVPAGGPVEHPTCGGFMAAQPALVIDVTTTVRWLRVYAMSPVDVGLRILGPDGHWRCADDTYGTHPAVDGRFNHGTWRVWVSTEDPGAAGAQTAVTFTTHRRQRPTDGTGASATAGQNGNPGTGTTATGGTLQSLAQTVVQTLTTAVDGQPAQSAAPPQPHGPSGAVQGGGQGGSSLADALARAGIDPNQLTTSVLSLLQRRDSGASALAPGQVLQLDQLGRSGLDTAQLQSVLGALLGSAGNGGSQGGAPMFDAGSLSRLADLARAGATLVQLQSAASQMLNTH